MQNRPSFLLTEVIVSVILLSFITINAMLIYKEFFFIKHNSFQQELLNLELLNSKLFLQENLQDISNAKRLNYKENQLLFDNALLLDNVTTFSLKHIKKHLHINLCLDNSLCKRFILP